MEEAKAWDIVQRVQTQIRVTGSSIAGFDMSAVLKLMEISRCASPVMIDLIDAGEKSIIEAVHTSKEKSDD